MTATSGTVTAACFTASTVFCTICGAHPHAPIGDGLACEPRQQLFSDELAAVMMLGACYNARSADEDREYLAAILTASDGYRFVVQPATAGAHQVRLRFHRLPGEVLVALWHTHGRPGVHRQLFSPRDTQLAASLDVPFYLSDPWGALRIFRPGDRARTRLRERGSRSPRGSSPGSIVATTEKVDDVPAVAAVVD